MEVRRTKEFDLWLKHLRDVQAKARILARWRSIATLGKLTGDIKPVGDGVFEMRFHFGPGYRVYFSLNGADITLLLIGGDKSTQSKDIRHAKQIKERLV